MGKIAIWGIVALLTFFIGMLFGATTFSGKTLVRKNVITFGRRMICAAVTLILVLVFGLSIWQTAVASSKVAEERRQQEQLDDAAAEAETAEIQTVSQNDTEPAGEDAGEDTKGAEEPEPETEEPDWESMSADYLLDKPNMDNGAIRALEMTERDIHRFDEEYGRVYDRQSSNEMEIYRISHMERLNAFGLSVLANQQYFEDNENDLEYLYAIDVADADIDDKVFAKARKEMADQYEEWEEELEDLDPDDNYEEFFRNKFKEEVLHNPLFCIAWYDLMSRHVVFTKNNPWVKENLAEMLKAYKLNPKENDVIGTATFLAWSDEHQEDEEKCSYTHRIVNDQMWEYASYAARMFELTSYDGVQKKDSARNWALDVDDKYSDLTQPEMLDKAEDQLHSKAAIFSVKENGKTLVLFGMNCYDSRLEEFSLAAPKKTTTTTQKKKKDPTYSLTVYYREQNTTKDLITPVPIGRFAAGHPYGPFAIVKIDDYTAITTAEQTIGTMPAADHAVVIWYKKNAAPPSNDNNPGGGGDPDPGGPGPKPGGDKPKDDKKDPENDDDNDRGRGDNDNKGDGDAEEQKPPAQDTKPSGDGQSGNGGSSGDSNNSDNTNHEGQGKDDAAESGGQTTVTEPSGGGDKTTSDPSKDKSDGHTDGGF